MRGGQDDPLAAAHCGLGAAHADLGELRAAESSLRAATLFHGGREEAAPPQVFYNLGNVQLRLHQLEDAAHAFPRARIKAAAWRETRAGAAAGSAGVSSLYPAARTNLGHVLRELASRALLRSDVATASALLARGRGSVDAPLRRERHASPRHGEGRRGRGRTRRHAAGAGARGCEAGGGLQGAELDRPARRATRNASPPSGRWEVESPRHIGVLS